MSSLKIRFYNDTWVVKRYGGGFGGHYVHKAVCIKKDIWFEVNDIYGLAIYVEGDKSVMDGYHTYLVNVPPELYEVKNGK